MGAPARILGEARKSPTSDPAKGAIYTIADEDGRLAHTVWVNLLGEVTHVWSHAYHDRRGQTVFDPPKRSDTCIWRAKDRTRPKPRAAYVIRLVREAMAREA